jgi:metal-dependent amidase/aminoacylase/carboxypeptidase family protein
MINVEFQGKPAHAASKPHEGINALDAMIQLFNNVGLLRQ